VLKDLQDVDARAAARFARGGAATPPPVETDSTSTDSDSEPDAGACDAAESAADAVETVLNGLARVLPAGGDTVSHSSSQPSTPLASQDDNIGGSSQRSSLFGPDEAKAAADNSSRQSRNGAGRGRNKLRRDMTAAEKKAAVWAKRVDPVMEGKITRIRAEILRRLEIKRQVEEAAADAAAAAASSDSSASTSESDPAVVDAMKFWRKTIPLDDSDGVWKRVIVVILELDSKGEVEQLCHGFNTCLVESFHSCRARLAKKDGHRPASWDALCQVSALRHNLGRGYLVEILKELGITPTAAEIESISRQEAARLEAVRHRSSSMVRMRLMRREKKRKIDRLRREIDASWPGSMHYLDSSLAVSTTARHLPYLFSRDRTTQHDQGSEEEDEEDKENV
jgi:hypothetical protein